MATSASAEADLGCNWVAVLATRDVGYLACGLTYQDHCCHTMSTTPTGFHLS